MPPPPPPQPATTTATATSNSNNNNSNNSNNSNNLFRNCEIKAKSLMRPYPFTQISVITIAHRMDHSWFAKTNMMIVQTFRIHDLTTSMPLNHHQFFIQHCIIQVTFANTWLHQPAQRRKHLMWPAPSRDHRWQWIISSWWFQPIWKICSSNWMISPGIGVKTKKMKPRARKICLVFTLGASRWLEDKFACCEGRDLQRPGAGWKMGFHEVKRHKRVSFLPWTFYIIDLKVVVVVVFVLWKSNIDIENDGFCWYVISPFKYGYFGVSMLVFGGVQIHTKCQPLLIPNSLDHMT